MNIWTDCVVVVACHQVVGSWGFIISASMFCLEVQSRWWKPKFFNLGWQVIHKTTMLKTYSLVLSHLKLKIRLSQLHVYFEQRRYVAVDCRVAVSDLVYFCWSLLLSLTSFCVCNCTSSLFVATALVIIHTNQLSTKYCGTNNKTPCYVQIGFWNVIGGFGFEFSAIFGCDSLHACCTSRIWINTNRFERRSKASLLYKLHANYTWNFRQDIAVASNCM